MADTPTEAADILHATVLTRHIRSLAESNRSAAIKGALDALISLDVIRPAQAGIVYDPRIIGSHRKARETVTEAIVQFLVNNEIILFDATRSPHTVELAGSLWVVLPAAQQNRTPAPPLAKVDA